MAADWKDMLASLRGDAEEEHEKEVEATPIPSEAPDDDIQKEKLHVVVEKKGRGGKIATIIEGFTISETALQALASELKKNIGTGGSARGGEILLQGDWREKVKTLLKNKGFKVS